MIRTFFNRFRIFPKGDGKVAEDWKRGDLAGCIAAGTWYVMQSGRENQGPKFGDIERVAAVKLERGWHMLNFEGWPNDWYTACEFRKITPKQDEACATDFALQMKRLRPKVDA